jgi:hypothetical protein
VDTGAGQWAPGNWLWAGTQPPSLSCSRTAHGLYLLYLLF